MPQASPYAHLNLNVRGMKPSATVAINERSNALIAAGRQVYKLGLGQSPFPVAEPVVQTLRDAAAEKDPCAAWLGCAMRWPPTTTVAMASSARAPTC